MAVPGCKVLRAHLPEGGRIIRVGLHFRVAFSKHILEALLQQQALKGFPLLWCKPCRGQVPASSNTSCQDRTAAVDEDTQRADHCTAVSTMQTGACRGQQPSNLKLVLEQEPGSSEALSSKHAYRVW